MKSLIPPQNVLNKIMTEIHNIKVESDLLDFCGIWDEECSLKIFYFIATYAPLLFPGICPQRLLKVKLTLITTHTCRY